MFRSLNVNKKNIRSITHFKSICMILFVINMCYLSIQISFTVLILLWPIYTPLLCCKANILNYTYICFLFLQTTRKEHASFIIRSTKQKRIKTCTTYRCRYCINFIYMYDVCIYKAQGENFDFFFFVLGYTLFAVL